MEKIIIDFKKKEIKGFCKAKDFKNQMIFLKKEIGEKKCQA